MSDTLLDDLYRISNSDNKTYAENISIPILQILKLIFREVTWPKIYLDSRNYDHYIRVTKSTSKQILENFLWGMGLVRLESG